MSIFPPYWSVEKIDTASNEAEKINKARLWILFFCDTPRRAWWANLLRPGFRHIAALSWYADQQRWVYFDPALRGTTIALFDHEMGKVAIEQLLARSSAVLRVASRHGRGAAPAFPWCVGAMKSLLGVRSPALTPWQLYWDLRDLGAEVVQAPCVADEPEAAAPSAA
jgi:hypothetical protein